MRLFSKLSGDYAINQSLQSSIDARLAVINLRRLLYTTMVAMPISLIEIAVFLLSPTSGNSKEFTWRMGIIIAQTTIFISMAILGVVAWFFRQHKQPGPILQTIPYIAALIILLAGAFTVTIDQWVTANITPYLIVCTIVGAIFIIRPAYAGILYLVSFVAFYVGLGFTQTNPVFLLSNRVNGLFALGIGFCLSYISWRTNVINLNQADFIKRQQMELEDKNQQLEQLAFIDPLTGLFNRRYFEEQLRSEIARLRRYGNESCIAIMDIDHFKRINDNYGHPAGDQLLIAIALLLNQHLRKVDILSRWGGEEFIILLPNTSLDAGEAVTEKIRQIIEKEQFAIGDYILQITVSFGVAQIINESKDAFEHSYIRADRALYHAKQNGRNRVETA